MQLVISHFKNPQCHLFLVDYMQSENCPYSLQGVTPCILHQYFSSIYRAIFWQKVTIVACTWACLHMCRVKSFYLYPYIPIWRRKHTEAKTNGSFNIYCMFWFCRYYCDCGMLCNMYCETINVCVGRYKFKVPRFNEGTRVSRKHLYWIDFHHIHT